MIDENSIYSLLFQKSERTEKKRQRFFLYLLLFPIFHFLLKNAFISSISLPFINLTQIEIALISIPLIYSFIIFYTLILTEHNSEIRDEMKIFEDNNSEKSKQWQYLIHPMNVIGEVVGSIKSGGCLGLTGVFIVFLPVILLALLIPIGFMIYFLIFNFTYETDLKYLSITIGFIAIWINIGSIIYSISKKKKIQKEVD